MTDRCRRFAPDTSGPGRLAIIRSQWTFDPSLVSRHGGRTALAADEVTTMATTQQSERSAAWRAVVAVRVPPTDGEDLQTSAGHRVQRAERVNSTTVDGVKGIEPTMSATVVTVAVRVETREAVGAERLSSELAKAPGAQRVESVEPA